MTAIGAFVGAGALPAGPVFAWAIGGAALGDSVGYTIGRCYKDRLLSVWPLSRYPKVIIKGRDFFEKHGGKSILIGRFVGPIRSAVPMIAGMLNLKTWRFFIAAVPSVILWAVLYLVPGIVLGSFSSELPTAESGRMVLTGIILIVLCWFIFWVIQLLFQSIVRTFNQFTRATWLYLKKHHGTHWFTRIIGNTYHMRDYQQLNLFVIATLLLALFCYAIINIKLDLWLTSWNQPIFHFLQSLRLPWADHTFILIVFLAAPIVILIGSLLAGILLLLKHHNKRTIIYLFLNLIITTGIIILYHNGLPAKHPTVHSLFTISQKATLMNTHLLLAVTLYGFLAYVIGYQLTPQWRYLPYCVLILTLGLITFGQLYVGADWFSHTVATLLLGTSLLLFIILAYRRKLPGAVSPMTSLGWLILASFLIPWIGYSNTHFEAAHHEYKRIWMTQSLNASRWWQAPRRFLPLYHLNRFGHATSPFNLQWAGELPNISALLTQNHWAITTDKKKNLQKTLTGFVEQNPSQQAPIIKTLYRDQPSALIAFHTTDDPNTLIEMHLWNSGYLLLDPNSPLWIGTINYRTINLKLFKRNKQHKITFRDNAGQQSLTSVLKPHYNYKVMQHSNETIPNRILSLQWDGAVLIIQPHKATKAADTSDKE